MGGDEYFEKHYIMKLLKSPNIKQNQNFFHLLNKFNRVQNELIYRLP